MEGKISELAISTKFYQEAKQAVADGVLSKDEKQKLQKSAQETPSPDDDALVSFLEDSQHVTAFKDASAGSDVPAYLDIPAAGDDTLRVKIKTDTEEAAEASKRGRDYLHAAKNAGEGTKKQELLQKARDEFQRALALQPNNVDAHNDLGVVCERLGKLDDAITHYRKALELSGPDAAPRTYYNLGLAYARQGNYELARENLQQAAQKRPKDLDTQYMLGVALQQLGRPDEALAQYTRLAELDTNGQYKNYLASQLSSLGKKVTEQAWKATDQETLLAHTDRAIAIYELLQQVSPDKDRVNQANYELGRLHFYRALNSYVMDSVIGRGTFKSYSHPLAHDKVQAHLDKAVEAFQAVTKARPEVGDAHYFLGRIHNFRGETQLAAQSLAEALKLQPNDPDVHVELAKNQWQQGNWEKTLQSYEKAIELLGEKLADKPDDVGLKEQMVELNKAVVGILNDKANSGLEGYKEAKRVASEMSDKLFDLRMRLNQEISKLNLARKSDNEPLPKDLQIMVNQLWAYAQTRPDLVAELTRSGVPVDKPPSTLGGAQNLRFAFSNPPSLKEAVLNSTLNVSKDSPPANVKASLSRTLALVEKVRPDVAAYIRDKLANKDLVLGGDGAGRIAAWITIGQDLVLYDDFFKLNDDEKASVLIHEINHAMYELDLRRRLSGLGHALGIPGKKNSMEYPAFLQQVAAFKELGITEKDHIYDVVKEGFVEETGYKWPPAENIVDLFKKIDKEALISSSADVFAANRSLARGASMKQRAEMIQFLLDQNPTSGDQEQLVYDILADASHEPNFKELLQNLRLKQLEDELPSKFMDQVRGWYRTLNQ